MSKDQIIFVVAVSIVAVIAITLAIYIPLRKAYLKGHFDTHYYKKLNSIVMNNDYFLINKFTFRLDGGNLETIDHIIGGEKYIYLISDFRFDGDLAGKISDSSLIHISHSGKKLYCDNPLIKVSKLMKKFISIMNIDSSLLIGIAIVNDECSLSIDGNDNKFFIAQRKRVSSLIKALESRNVGTINQESLQALIKTIDKMNKRKR